MPKLKLQSFGHLMRKSDSFEKTPMLGEIEGGRRRGRQRMRWLGGITDSMGMSLGGCRELGTGKQWTGRPGVLRSVDSESRTRRGDRTELTREHHIVSVHSPVDGRARRFRVLATVSRAVTSTGLHVSL